ncbi:nucleoside 2-deoxyribosyltransferase [Paenibacillus thailandensis]|uniref:Nucleoside 2-deoxyribosyltransferase n=1 Tax=Paenibacillus thailandensis TaxID=393250 RepID=A0ABW5QX56_9BACL
MSNLKIYLAGFEVFYPNAVELGKEMKELCAKYGFEGLYPLDKEIKPLPTGRETAAAIFEGNVNLIREADIIIANLNPFRGEEPDSGTVFECGLGYGWNKKLYAHVKDARTMAERLQPGTDPETGLYRDGMTIEEFGLSNNLMLSIPVTIVEGTLEDALRRVRADLEAEQA